MKSLKHVKLSSDLIRKITTYFPSKKFKTQSHLFYEGQIPISGFLIVNGAIQISRKKKFKTLLPSGSLVGVFELMNKIPIPISAEVFPDSEICFLDKTTLLEISKTNDLELASLLNQLFKAPA